jgi:hypothetical protein
MSLTKKKFSLRKSRKVQKQPERNFNLERIINNNNNNNNDDEMIIIPKNKVAELQDKFTYINSLVDLRDMFNTDIFNSNDNLIITKSQFPKEHQYSYFKGPKGINVHKNTAEAISADKLWSLLPDALYKGHVPTRYLRILQDFLGDIDRVSLSDRSVQIERPSRRSQATRKRRANMAIKALNRNYNNNNNNVNNKLAKRRLTRRRESKHGRTQKQHERTKRNNTIKKSISKLLAK